MHKTMSVVSTLLDHVRDQPVRHAIAAVGVSAATIWCVRRLIHRMKYRYPPGPFALPLLGTYNIVSTKGCDYCFKECDRLYKMYGDMVTLVIAGTPTILVLNPELVQEGLMSKQLTDRNSTFYSLNYLTEGMNNIFASPNNERWRFHRKCSYSAFRMFVQSDRLEQFIIDSFDSVKKYFAEAEEPRDLYETMYLLTYNLQCRMTFSKEYTPNDPEFLHLRGLIEGLNTSFQGLPVDVISVLKYLPLKSTRDFKKLADGIVNWAKNLCEQRKKTFNPSELNDILDFLISEQEEAIKSGHGNLFLDVHLRQTLIDIFVAGTDTTTFTLYWVVTALSMYPDMQERCFIEICSAVGQDRTPTLADRDKLPYTDAFLHEVMRIWPLGPIVPRQCNEDCTLGGYTFPQGTQVLLSTYRCHSDPKAFPNPRQFAPEHFLNEKGKMAPYNREFLPFGAGTRVCLGESIAKKTTFLLTVLLIQNFRFEKAEQFDSPISDSSSFFFCTPRRVKTRVVPRSE